MSDSPPSSIDPAKAEQKWREAVKSLLKVELKRQNLTYDDVAKRLQAIGIQETEVSIRNKISRGTFPATFLLQFMHVLGVQLIPFKPDMTAEVILPPELVAAMQGLRWPSKGGLGAALAALDRRAGPSKSE